MEVTPVQLRSLAGTTTRRTVLVLSLTVSTAAFSPLSLGQAASLAPTEASYAAKSLVPCRRNLVLLLRMQPSSLLLLVPATAILVQTRHANHQFAQARSVGPCRQDEYHSWIDRFALAAGNAVGVLLFWNFPVLASSVVTLCSALLSAPVFQCFMG